jgi:phytoene desaturase
VQKVIVIGSGFAGLSAACHLAKDGADVIVLEKNSQPGGRARSFTEAGFTFDMGPSWYWMPDVFEQFFAHFNTTPAAYYELVRLDPSYRVIWDDETIDVPADYKQLKSVFERLEQGAGKQLDLFMDEAEYKYHAAMTDLVYQPGISITEFMRKDVFKSLFRIDLLKSIHKHARRYFTHPKLLQLIEFPILFLGALPKNTPALYTLMNYADMKLGTWYPMGGMVQVVNAMCTLAKQLGVRFVFNDGATNLLIEDNKVYGVRTTHNTYHADAVIAACDYAHAEQLMPDAYRNYTGMYWQTRTMAPSCLIYYIGLNKKLNNILHHNLLFDVPFHAHAQELYDTPRWPKNPLMYVCCPSQTDGSVAPEGCENIFVLIPVAPGLKDNETIKQQYYKLVLARLEKTFNEDIKDAVIYKRMYAASDFITDYNALAGNAYGLANTLSQTALLKPSIKNKNLNNLFYAGQLTVPGPGVPPAIISGQIVATEAGKLLKLKNSAHYDVPVP